VFGDLGFQRRGVSGLRGARVRRATSFQLFGFRVWGLGVEVQGLGFRCGVWGLGR